VLDYPIAELAHKGKWRVGDYHFATRPFHGKGVTDYYKMFTT
jgi:hypothetical protein